MKHYTVTWTATKHGSKTSWSKIVEADSAEQAKLKITLWWYSDYDDNGRLIRKGNSTEYGRAAALQARLVKNI